MTGDDVANAVAYRVDYVDRDGRQFATAVDTVDEARDLVAEIAADGGRIIAKHVERGYEAACLLRAVRQTELATPEVF